MVPLVPLALVLLLGAPDASASGPAAAGESPTTAQRAPAKARKGGRGGGGRDAGTRPRPARVERRDNDGPRAERHAEPEERDAPPARPERPSRAEGAERARPVDPDADDATARRAPSGPRRERGDGVDASSGAERDAPLRPPPAAAARAPVGPRELATGPDGRLVARGALRPVRAPSNLRGPHGDRRAPDGRVDGERPRADDAGQAPSGERRRAGARGRDGRGGRRAYHDAWASQRGGRRGGWVRPWYPGYPRSWYHGVFVYGPYPWWGYPGDRVVVLHDHDSYADGPPARRRAPPAPRREVDHEGDLSIGLRTGTYASGYAGGAAYADAGLGVAMRYRATEGVGLEVAWMQASQQWSGDTERVQQPLQVSVQGFAFPWTRVNPYASVGMTVTQRDVDDLVGGVPVQTQATSWGPHVGVGLEVGLGKSVSLGLEADWVGYLAQDVADPSDRGAVVSTLGVNAYF
ncbi:MAG: hypothetical protein RLZZ299_2616 [Pseudomonadota bacterium]